MRTLLNGKPWSVWWFIVTAIVFALQLFPLTGVFLMFALAPFWSVATINLGFASIIPEVLFRRISPAWLVLPLVWFGGYAGAAFLSHAKVAALDAEIRAANSAQRFPFDPAQQSLVISAANDYTLSSVASSLVRDYRIPVAYTEQRSNKDAPYRASRLMTDPACQTINRDRRNFAAGVQSNFISTGKNDGHRGKPSGICLVTMPEAPSLPVVRIEGKREKHSDLIAPYELIRATIHDPSGTTLAQVSSGFANPLHWLPMPILGCALNSGSPSWDCMAMFWRTNVGIGGQKTYGHAVDEALPPALGLEKVSPFERRAEIEAASQGKVEAVVEQSANAALATLDAVISDPKKRIIIHDVNDLRENIALFADRVPAMVGAISRALDNGTPTYETARVLQELLAQLPPAEFAALGGRLLDVLRAQKVIDDRTVSDALATRLGELGSPALPVLEKLVFPPAKRPALGAIYGLCRMGPAAASRAEDLVALATDGRRRDIDSAIFVTLRRLGRDDLIERGRADGTGFSKVPKKLAERAITPESPPSACGNESGYPRVPA